MAPKDTLPPPTPSSTTSSTTSSPVPRITPTSPILLNTRQESEIRDIYQAHVRAHCAAQIKQFAECARSHTLTVNFRCAEPKLAMNACLRAHGTQEAQDAARHEWFATVEARKAQREQKEVERRDNEARLKEWWGMDDDWRRVDRRLESVKPGGIEKASGG